MSFIHGSTQYGIAPLLPLFVLPPHSRARFLAYSLPLVVVVRLVAGA